MAGSLAWLGRKPHRGPIGKGCGLEEEGRIGERSAERGGIPESKGLSWSDIKPFLASMCGASCGGGSRALGPAKFRVYGHATSWGPGASASSGGSLQLRVLESDLACEPSSLWEANEAGGPKRRENDHNVESVENECCEGLGEEGKKRTAMATKSGGSHPATREGCAEAPVSVNAAIKRRMSCAPMMAAMQVWKDEEVIVSVITSSCDTGFLDNLLLQICQLSLGFSKATGISQVADHSKASGI